MSVSLIAFIVSVIEYFSMDKELIEKIAKRIKFLRKQKGLKQEHLAVDANVSRSTIGMIETARNDITLSKINRIAKALGIELHELLKFDERP